MSRRKWAWVLGGMALLAAVVKLGGAPFDKSSLIAVGVDGWKFIQARREAERLSMPIDVYLAIEKLHSDDAAARCDALNTIISAEHSSDMVIEAVLEATQDSDNEVRARAIDAVGEASVPPNVAAPIIIAAFDDPAPNVRCAACGVFSGLDDATVEKHIRLLLRAMDDPATRLAAVDAIAVVGPPAAAAIDKLIEFLHDDEAATREHSAFALMRVNADPSKALAPLLNAFGDPQYESRASVAMALGKIGRASPERVVPALAAALNDPDDEVRHDSAMALQEFGPDAAAAVPALIAALANDDNHDRDSIHQFIVALAKIGPAAKSAVPTLLERFRRLKELSSEPGAADDGLWEVQHLAAAIALLDTAAAIEVLPVLLDMPPDFVDTSGMAASMGAGNDYQEEEIAAEPTAFDQVVETVVAANSEAALPVLLEHLRSSNEYHARTAERLVAVGETTPAAAGPLREIAGHVNEWGAVSGNVYALAALAQIAPDDAVYGIRGLVELLDDGNGQALAIDALVAIGRNHPAEVVETIQGALANRYGTDRVAVIRVAGRLGPSAAPLVDAIQALTTDHEVGVDAIVALAAIDPSVGAEHAANLVAAFVQPGVAGRSEAAADALVRMAALAPDQVVPRMTHLIDRREDSATRLKLLELLRRIGPAAAGALPSIKELLNDPYPAVRAAAAATVAKIEPTPPNMESSTSGSDSSTEQPAAAGEEDPAGETD